jgi:hypothetical protein
MTSSDRTIRREQVKAIGRAAFRLACAAPMEGYIVVEGQRLRLRTFDRDYLSITLYEAANREPTEHDLSRLRITYKDRKVMEISWSAAGAFRTLRFEPGDWIEDLPAVHNRS